MKPAQAALFCTGEVEGNLHFIERWLAMTGQPYPYGEVA